MGISSSLFAISASILISAGPAQAQEFYKGKSVTLFAGQPAGGSIDSEMRLAGHFLGQFIPGRPAIVPRNMPGAGGILFGNYLYSIARPDGLTLGMPGRSGFVLAPMIGAADTKYDLRRFTWIGSSASSNFVLWMRRAANVRTFEDLRAAGRTIIIAGSGSTTANSIIPEVLAKYEGIPFKVVRGYLGINDAVLAVERGEADGVLCQRASIRPDLLAATVPVFQLFDVEPRVPILSQLVTSQNEKMLLELLSAPQRLGLPVVAPPGLSAELTAVLREAYLEMVTSKDYIAEAEKRGFDVGPPNSGAEIAAYISEKLLAFPAETISEYRSYVERQ